MSAAHLHSEAWNHGGGPTVRPTVFSAFKNVSFCVEMSLLVHAWVYQVVKKKREKDKAPPGRPPAFSGFKFELFSVKMSLLVHAWVYLH